MWVLHFVNKAKKKGLWYLVSLVHNSKPCVCCFIELSLMCLQVQILSKKVDVSKVTSKCGSRVNIKHKPGKVLT